MSSLVSGLAILQCFSAETPERGVTEIATRLGMPKSSVSRLMKAMADAALLEQDTDRRTYRPGALSFQLGNLYRRHLKVLDLVDQELRELVESSGLTGYIGVLNGADMVIIQSRQGTYPVRLVLEKGYRVPAFATAAGLAMLARSDDAEIRRIHPPRLHYGETGIAMSIEQLLDEVRAVRDQGFAQVVGRTFTGFCAIAVAVESEAEQQRLSFSLSFPQAALSADAVRTVAATMVAAAARIGARTHDRVWMEWGASGAAQGALRLPASDPAVVRQP